jgi:hypothetical protein
MITPTELGPKPLGLKVDSLKHTFLTRVQSAPLAPRAAGSPWRVPPSRGMGTQDLSQLAVVEARRTQREVKADLSDMYRQSTHPAVIKMYAASINSTHGGASLYPAKKAKKRIFNSMPQSHMEAQRDVREILSVAIVKGRLPTITGLPVRKAAELVVDTRPRPPGVIPNFEKRITQAGMPEIEHFEQTAPFPLSPYRICSQRNEPDLVYTPAGISDLLVKCIATNKAMHTVADLPPEEAVQRGIRIQVPSEDDVPYRSSSGPSPAEKMLLPERNLPTSAASTVRSITPTYVQRAETAMRSAHQHCVSPTRTTLAARERLIRVRAHLQWRKAMTSSELDQSNMVGLPMGGGMGRRSVTPQPAAGAVVMSPHHASSSHVVAEHRGKIVKAIHNR